MPLRGLRSGLDSFYLSAGPILFCYEVRGWGNHIFFPHTGDWLNGGTGIPWMNCLLHIEPRLSQSDCTVYGNLFQLYFNLWCFFPPFSIKHFVLDYCGSYYYIQFLHLLRYFAHFITVRWFIPYFLCIYFFWHCLCTDCIFAHYLHALLLLWFALVVWYSFLIHLL